VKRERGVADDSHAIAGGVAGIAPRDVHEPVDADRPADNG